MQLGQTSNSSIDLTKERKAEMKCFSVSEQSQLSEVLTLIMDLGIADGPDSIAAKLDWSTDDLIDFIVAADNEVQYPLDEDQYDSLLGYVSTLNVTSNGLIPDNVLALQMTTPSSEQRLASVH